MLPPCRESGLSAQAAGDSRPQAAVLAIQVEPRVLLVLLQRKDWLCVAVAVVVVAVSLSVETECGRTGRLVDRAAADQHRAPAARSARPGDAGVGQDLAVLLGRDPQIPAGAVLDQAIDGGGLAARHLQPGLLAAGVKLGGRQLVVDLVELPLEVLRPQRLQDDAGFIPGQLVESIKLLDEAVNLLDQDIWVAGRGGGLYVPAVLGAVWDLVRRDLRAFQHLRYVLGHGRVEVAPKGAQRRLATTLAL